MIYSLAQNAFNYTSKLAENIYSLWPVQDSIHAISSIFAEKQSFEEPADVSELNRRKVQNRQNLIDEKNDLKEILDEASIERNTEKFQRKIRLENSETSFAEVLCDPTDMHAKHITITTRKGLHKADRDVWSFFMKHEAAHIKNRDSYLKNTNSMLSSLAVLAIGIANLSMTSLLGLTYLTYKTVSIISSQHTEIAADQYAIEKSSDEELLGGRRGFKAIRLIRLWDRKFSKSWNAPIFNSSQGENRKDIVHPSTKSRINRIEEEILNRKIEFDENQENKKIEKLARFFLKKSHINFANLNENSNSYFSKFKNLIENSAFMTYEAVNETINLAKTTKNIFQHCYQKFYLNA